MRLPINHRFNLNLCTISVLLYNAGATIMTQPDLLLIPIPSAITNYPRNLNNLILSVHAHCFVFSAMDVYNGSSAIFTGFLAGNVEVSNCEWLILV